MYMCKYIHMYMCVYIYIYIHIYMYIYVCVCVCASVHIYIYICVCVCARAFFAKSSRRAGGPTGDGGWTRCEVVETMAYARRGRVCACAFAVCGVSCITDAGVGAVKLL